MSYLLVCQHKQDFECPVAVSCMIIYYHGTYHICMYMHNTGLQTEMASPYRFCLNYYAVNNTILKMLIYSSIHIS